MLQVAFLNFVIGAYSMVPIAELMEATTSAVFICFARHPEFLSSTYPDLFYEINNAYEMLTGEPFLKRDADMSTVTEHQVTQNLPMQMQLKKLLAAKSTADGEKTLS
eukprot:SAG31_NODE_3500_length_4192_cov_2.220621_2_plen_107_part_00